MVWAQLNHRRSQTPNLGTHIHPDPLPTTHYPLPTTTDQTRYLLEVRFSQADLDHRAGPKKHQKKGPDMS
jgi:hypothetical protein